MKSDEILIKTFNQVKNDNFDQVKFDQVIVCLQTNTENNVFYGRNRKQINKTMLSSLPSDTQFIINVNNNICKTDKQNNLIF